MNALRAGLVFILLAGVSLSADAGSFFCSSFGDISCVDNINDLVTDKFTRAYPADKFKIVAIYEFDKFSSGGGTGFAVVGVSPIIPGSKQSLVPPVRFSHVKSIKDGVSINPYDVNQLERELLRDAIEAMMAACDASPQCDLN